MALIVIIAVLVPEVNYQASYLETKSKPVRRILFDVGKPFGVVAVWFGCVLKLYTMRRAHGRSPWDVFDDVIILASILTEFAEGIPGLSSLRILKLARLGNTLPYHVELLRVVPDGQGVRKFDRDYLVAVCLISGINLTLVAPCGRCNSSSGCANLA